jgi:hypothetical protein
MASLLSRFTSFVPNTTILSDDHNQEFNRIVQLLNGTTTNLKTVLKTSDAGDPPLELDQLSTGPILKLSQGGILKAQFRNTGGLWVPGIYDTNDNEELLFVATGSAVNEFTITNAATGNRPTLSATGGNTDIGMNISPKGTGQVFITGSSPLRLATGVAPSNDDDAARKKYVDDKAVFFAISFKIDDPSTFPTADLAALPTIRVPAIASGFLTRLHVIFRSGSHTAGGSLTFDLKNNTGSVATVQLNDTNNTANTFYTNDFADAAISESNALTVDISARSGTINERDVTVVVEGYQKVKSV